MPKADNGWSKIVAIVVAGKRLMSPVITRRAVDEPSLGKQTSNVFRNASTGRDAGDGELDGGLVWYSELSASNFSKCRSEGLNAFFS